MTDFYPQINPGVEVIPVPLEVAIVEPAYTDLGQAGPTVDSQKTLEGFIVNAHLNDLLQARRDNADTAYLLRWNGGRVPRGAVVGSRVIAWTQHGRVIDRDHQWVGDYKRVKDCVGPNGENEMLVFMQPEPTDSPDLEK